MMIAHQEEIFTAKEELREAVEKVKGLEDKIKDLEGEDGQCHRKRMTLPWHWLQKAVCINVAFK